MGTIGSIQYVPLGPGAVNVELLSLQPVTQGPVVPDIPLEFTFSFFAAEVKDTARELIVHYLLVPPGGFGDVISFRTKD